MMDGLNERDQILPQPGKNAGDIGGLGARFVVIQQSVVRDASAAAECCGLFSFQGDNLLEPGSEGLKMRFLTSVDPIVLRQRGDAGNLFNQLFGQLGGSIVASASFSQICPFWAVGVAKIVLLFHLADQFAQTGRRESLVNHARQQAHLFRAMRYASRRKIGLLVPRKLGGARRQERPLAPFIHQLIVKLVRRGHCPPPLVGAGDRLIVRRPKCCATSLRLSYRSTSTRSGAGGALMSAAIGCFARRRALYQSTTIGITEITRMAAITK